VVRRSFLLLIALAAIAIAANIFMLQRFVWQATEQDPRNEGVDFASYYRYGILPSEIVLDLWSVGGAKSMADVSRVLLMIASQLKDREFQLVLLAWRGDARFAMKGSYFAELGREFGAQNPVYTLRTMPENMFLLDGRPAFETWTGGLLAVLGQQMEDLKSLHMRWYGESAFAGSR
jgi:hypothetical protein